MIQPPSIYLSPDHQTDIENIGYKKNYNYNSDEINNIEIDANHNNKFENKLTTNTPILNFNIKKKEKEEDDEKQEKNETINNNINENSKEKLKKKKKSYSKFIGIIIVFLIAFFNSTFLELSQLLVSDRYHSAFAFSWFNSLFLILAIIIEFILLKIELNKEYKQSLIINLDSIVVNSNQNNLGNEHHYELSDDYDGITTTTTTTKIKPIETLLERYKSKFKVERKIDNLTGKSITTGFTFKRLFITSIPISILFVMLNWLWMLGLSMTEVSISTALYQSATVFCFILSIIILKEKIKLLKSISVLLYIGGIVGIGLTAANSTESYPSAVKGDIITIASASLWALYEVLTSKYIGSANRTVVHTYMGFIAIVNFMFGIPMILIYHYSKFEPFQLPDVNLFGMLFLNGMIGFSINYLITWGLSVTSPLFVRSGEILSIPATLFFDIIVKHMKLPLLAIPGFVLIIIGFIVSLINETREIKENEKLKKQQQITIEKREQKPEEEQPEEEQP